MAQQQQKQANIPPRPLPEYRYKYNEDRKVNILQRIKQIPNKISKQDKEIAKELTKKAHEMIPYDKMKNFQILFYFNVIKAIARQIQEKEQQPSITTHNGDFKKIIKDPSKFTKEYTIKGLKKCFKSIQILQKYINQEVENYLKNKLPRIFMKLSYFENNSIKKQQKQLKSREQGTLKQEDVAAIKSNLFDDLAPIQCKIAEEQKRFQNSDSSCLEQAKNQFKFSVFKLCKQNVYEFETCNSGAKATDYLNLINFRDYIEEENKQRQSTDIYHFEHTCRLKKNPCVFKYKIIKIPEEFKSQFNDLLKSMIIYHINIDIQDRMAHFFTKSDIVERFKEQNKKQFILSIKQNNLLVLQALSYYNLVKYKKELMEIQMNKFAQY